MQTCKQKQSKQKSTVWPDPSPKELKVFGEVSSEKLRCGYYSYSEGGWQKLGMWQGGFFEEVSKGRTVDMEGQI